VVDRGPAGRRGRPAVGRRPAGRPRRAGFDARSAAPAAGVRTGSAGGVRGGLPGAGARPAAGGRGTRPAPPWLPALLVGWAAGAALLLARVALHHVRLFRLLAPRRELTDGTLPATLAALRRGAGVWTPVRLTTSANCPTPIAIGRREICVPERFVAELGADEQRSALAHELAHIQRNDPLWQLAAGLLESLFFFQPLNRAARHRLRDAAENLCDDWAVRQTGSPLALARCLTSIAAWVSAAPVPSATLAMAEGGSPLVDRVARLAEWREPARRLARLRLPATSALLLAVAATAPAVSQGGTPPSGAAEPASRSGAASARDTVIVPPGAPGPLADRWRAAGRSAPGARYWVAWGVAAPPRLRLPGGLPLASSSDRRPPGAPTPTLGHLLRGAGAAAAPVNFVFGVDRSPAGGAVRSLQLRSAESAPALDGRPVVWLGAAGTAESLALLRELHGAADDVALRAEIAAAIALHDDPRAVLAAVAALLSAEPSPRVRAEAVQWLPRAHPGAEALIPLLLDAARRDTARAVRVEAVDALAALGSERARRALARVAGTHPDLALRSEAAQALARPRRD
jgi:beta-lactamase regulating signal transducer with metallopeptidase domain